MQAEAFPVFSKPLPQHGPLTDQRLVGHFHLVIAEVPGVRLARARLPTADLAGANRDEPGRGEGLQHRFDYRGAV